MRDGVTRDDGVERRARAVLRGAGRVETHRVRAEQRARGLLELLERAGGRAARARIGERGGLVELDQVTHLVESRESPRREPGAREHEDALARGWGRKLERDDLEAVAWLIAHRERVRFGMRGHAAERALAFELLHREECRGFELTSDAARQRELDALSIGKRQLFHGQHPLEQGSEVDVLSLHGPLASVQGWPQAAPDQRRWGRAGG
jgi:hypothetical protein